MAHSSKESVGVTALASGSLPSVSVVMPTYRRSELLPSVIAPVLVDDATTELMVVVDGTHDGSLELLERHARHDARLRPMLVEHGGAARARQVGVERATGEVVLLLDDDVIAGPNLVAGHARRHAEGSGLVVVGTMPVRLDGLARRGNFTAYLYAHEYERFSAAYETDPNRVLLWLWGGNISIRRDDALRVGLESPSRRRYDYHEDRDFGLRCRRAGLIGVYDPPLRAEHLHTRSLAAFLRDARRQGRDDVRLHRDHRDLIGPFDMAAEEANLGLSFRLAVRLSRIGVIGVLEMTALRLVLRAAGWLGWFRLETRAAVILRRIEQRRAIDAELAAGRAAAGARVDERA
jgi:GT2 family glycosyltransferase